MKLQQLEDEYAAKLRAERMRPGQGVEERMAIYRQEIEDQARAEVARQVSSCRCMHGLADPAIEQGIRLLGV